MNVKLWTWGSPGQWSLSGQTNEVSRPPVLAYCLQTMFRLHHSEGSPGKRGGLSELSWAELAELGLCTGQGGWNPQGRYHRGQSYTEESVRDLQTPDSPASSAEYFSSHMWGEQPRPGNSTMELTQAEHQPEENLTFTGQKAEHSERFVSVVIQNEPETKLLWLYPTKLKPEKNQNRKTQPIMERKTNEQKQPCKWPRW